MPRAMSSVLSVIASLHSLKACRRFAHSERPLCSNRSRDGRHAATFSAGCAAPEASASAGALSLGGDTWGYAPAAALFNSFGRVLNVTASFH